MSQLWLRYLQIFLTDHTAVEIWLNRWTWECSQFYLRAHGTLLSPWPQTHITWMQCYIIQSPCWTHKTDLLSGLGPLLISLIPQNADMSLKTDSNSKLPLCLHAWDSFYLSFSPPLNLIFSPNFLFSHFWIIILNLLTQLWAMIEPLREFWPAESLHYHY